MDITRDTITMQFQYQPMLQRTEKKLHKILEIIREQTGIEQDVDFMAFMSTATCDWLKKSKGIASSMNEDQHSQYQRLSIPKQQPKPSKQFEKEVKKQTSPKKNRLIDSCPNIAGAALKYKVGRKHNQFTVFGPINKKKIDIPLQSQAGTTNLQRRKRALGFYQIAPGKNLSNSKRKK